MKNSLWDNIFRRNSEKDQVIKILRDNFLFQDLSGKELRFVHNIIHVREYRPGEEIFNQDEIGVGMYIIIKGRADIFVKDHQVPTDTSKNILVTQLKHGDFFGELSLVEDHGRRKATAIAHDETRLIGFFKPDLMEILERNPVIGVKVVYRLAEVLGRRLLETTQEISNLRQELESTQEKLPETKGPF